MLLRVMVLGSGVATEDVEGTVGLYAGVVEDVFASATKFVSLAGFDHGTAFGVFLGAAAGTKNVAKDVEGAFGGAGCGNVLEDAFDVVAPDAYVHVGAFAFDGIVPHARYEVAVDVRIAVGAAFKAVVGTAANGVVEAVGIGADNFVVADDVVARGISEADGLGTCRVACVPVVGAAAWVFDAVALNDEVTRPTVCGDGAVVVAFVAKCFWAAYAPPKGDAAVFDDDVMTAIGNANAVDGCVFEFETTDDDVVGVYGDVVVGLVAHVEGGAGFGWRGVEVVACWCARFGDLEGRGLGCEVGGFAYGECFI